VVPCIVEGTVEKFVVCWL